MTKKLERARTALLEAALQPHMWERALSAVADASGAKVGQLIVRHEDGSILTHLLTGMRDGFVAEIEAFGLADPSINPRAELGLNAPPMTPVLDQDFVSADARKKLPIYAEMFEPSDVPFNCQAVLMRGETLVRASVSRTNAQGAFDANAVRAFSTLMPMLQSVVRLQVSLGAERLTTALSTLNSIAAPAFIVDVNGRVLATSSPAEILLASGALKLVSNRLSLPHRSEDEAFHARLAGTLRCARAGAASDVPTFIARTPDGATLQIDFHALPSERDVLGSGPAALVIVQRKTSPVDRAAKHLANLTPTEADLARRLLNGASIAEIASARAVATATVRSQLQSIFMKLGVRRQAELVRLLSGKD